MSAGPGYAAGVPRPPIGFAIDVPDHWDVLDLNPDTWDGWLDGFLDGRVAARDERDRRGAARQAILDVMRRLHQEKVFMAAILTADAGGELVSASATLAWRQVGTEGEPIPVAGLREVYRRAPASPGEDAAARRVEEVTLPAGVGVKVATRQTMRLPGLPESRPVALTQYFVPVLASNWLAVVTASTGNPPLAAGVEEVADGMAASLRFIPAPA